MSPEPRAAASLLMFACLLMLGSLFAVTGLRQFFVEPLSGTVSNVIWFVIQVLPLLAVLPGMLRQRYRSYFFAILAGTLYFVHGVWLAVAEAHRALGLWEVAFALLLVLLCTYMVRLLRSARGE